MSKVAIQFLVLNIGICTFSLLIFGFMYTEIKRLGEDLIKSIEIKREQEAKKESALVVRRLVHESADDRDILKSSFFLSESDSIQFLTATERAASQIGLTITTEGLEKRPLKLLGKEMSVIEIVFSFSGRTNMVKNFLQYLETLPNHSRLESLSLRQTGTGDTWSARVTLLITILNDN